MPGPTHIPPKRPGRLLLRVLVGEVLRRTRLEQGRTLADVARAARVSMQYLSELERGRKEASSEVLAAVCGALRIELSDVLTEVARTLATERVREATIVRLAAFHATRARAPRSGSGDAYCLVA